MTIKKMLILILFLSGPQTFFKNSALAGGNFVGNGAGLGEFRFQTAYNDLSQHIRFCLDYKLCQMTSQEEVLLNKILSIAIANTSNADRLQFISEKDFPGFFQTTQTELHRIAKTDLNQTRPIYINRDLLYDVEGNSLLDYPTASAILIHEIGHQTGEADHQVLDVIAAKVGLAISSRSSKYEIKLGNPEKKIEAQIITLESPFKRSEIYISSGPTQVRKVSDDIFNLLTCENPKQLLSSFEFYNGHFTLSEDQFKSQNSFGFSAWGDLYCYDPEKNLITSQKFQIFLDLDFSLNPFSSKLQRW